ncbi:MAG: YbhB/YbcL family Raf kinase inhibitor-like protein [Caulobacter sp.]|uniref:YbhB/YbcL family Raf kinase inhibitor-like protein n=1 Tax=Caulobacter sp. CCH9-E1 TaxID=1768768 RepID=UPI0008341744|nr:YbhB/YbcL family Raf kinase inhibitor-like protein [Caulobacter sp. CCH9-E1]MCK5909787.1 YbhB/YbcL family Raf kinase inhibitor-like protein [Caulobacter sp.]
MAHTPASTPEHSGEAISIQKVAPFGPDGDRAIVLTTTAQDLEGRLEDRCSAYHDNISPPLVWTPAEGAVAYAIVVEDPDAPRERPFIHWLIWNIPGEATSLPEGLPAEPSLGLIGGATQGRNDSGSIGWFGPKPPPGHGAHHYQFQIFALAERLTFGPETPLDVLLNALKGETLADGLMVATYERADASPA